MRTVSLLRVYYDKHDTGARRVLQVVDFFQFIQMALGGGTVFQHVWLVAIAMEILWKWQLSQRYGLQDEPFWKDCRREGGSRFFVVWLHDRRRSSSCVRSFVLCRSMFGEVAVLVVRCNANRCKMDKSQVSAFAVAGASPITASMIP